jgi:hypothetical protein
MKPKSDFRFFLRPSILAFNQLAVALYSVKRIHRIAISRPLGIHKKKKDQLKT